MITAMIDDLFGLVHSLIQVMEEESETLALMGRCPGLSDLAEAKGQLVNRLESSLAALNRRYADWPHDMGDEKRAEMDRILHDLRNAAKVNADILQRQIDLSGDMLSAVGQEMQRLTGRRSESYCPAGRVSLREGNAPLSINYRL
ncbi:flagellar protein FlgN [Sphingobium sp. B2]|uniref:flagellar protein FlgN n=1 Tax=Sphingobium sp. B2 TaxID=2583228 RepID=UPI0011A95598|nr:flagellar protein FlgN [Sphingobium sp. B2]